MIPRAALGTLFLALAACRSEPGVPLEPEGDLPPPADAVAGRAAFVASCAACHSSRDGFDLAFFGFPDSTIVRRAVFHVDSATARDIAAHVRTVAAPRAGRGTRPFQPGGVVLSGDVEFATRLFGADVWPVDLTAMELRAIDPLEVLVAVPVPRWSVEFDNVDWMPARPLPDAILEARGGAPERALERYYANPSLENLLAAVSGLRMADRDVLADAPCARPDGVGPVLDGPACFELRRWTASLAAQHALRFAPAGRLHPLAHDAWWDVGNAARLATEPGNEIEHRVENWASWMLLGWVFEPGRHASVYTGNALVRMALPRHATFVALRSEVARPRGSGAVYADVANAARFAPAPWAFAATRLAYGHLLERLGGGETPAPGEALQEARLQVQAAYASAAPKVTAAQRAELAALRDGILARLE